MHSHHQVISGGRSVGWRSLHGQAWSANIDVVTPASDDTPFGDVERLFGYVDVIDDSRPVKRVAPEILVMSCFTQRFCAALIRAAKASGAFSSHPDDPIPGHEVSIRDLSPVLYNAMQNDLGARIWPQLQEHWQHIDYFGLNDAFVIKYEKGGQEELRLHHDVAQVSASVKLNESYEGAELEFPRQEFSNKDLRVGDIVVWPSLVTHPHRSTPLVSGTKYSLTLWFELPLQIT